MIGACRDGPGATKETQMLYFKITEDLKVAEISDKFPDEMRVHNPEGWWRRFDGSRVAGWACRTDFDTMLMAQAIAAAASEKAGKLYMASDSGPSVSPRYDVVEAPAVGDDCSRGFNGDYYPVGKIVAITPGSMRIVTVDGPRGKLRFYRRGERAAWVQAGGTWSLVPGVRNEWNPEV